MCGYHAARAALRDMFDKRLPADPYTSALPAYSLRHGGE
jgi:hypothetical protein